MKPDDHVRNADVAVCVNCWGLCKYIRRLSYSGSRVSGKQFPAATSQERIHHLKTQEATPEMILVYIGFNDFGHGVKISHRKSLFSKTDLDYFEDAYQYMLKALKANYPSAKIVSGTLMRTEVRDNPEWIFPERFAGIEFEAYNQAIRKITKKSLTVPFLQRLRFGQIKFARITLKIGSRYWAWDLKLKVQENFCMNIKAIPGTLPMKYIQR